MTMIWFILFLEWFAIQEVQSTVCTELVEPSDDSQHALPLLFPYGHCTEQLSPETLTIHLTHTLSTPYKINPQLSYINNKYLANFKDFPPIEGELEIPVLLTDQLATGYWQCRGFFCGEKTLNSSVCSKSDLINGVRVNTFGTSDPTIQALAVVRGDVHIQVLPLMPQRDDNAPTPCTTIYTYYALYGEGMLQQSYTVPTLGILAVGQRPEVNISTTGEILVYKNREMVKSNSSQWWPDPERLDSVWMQSTGDTNTLSLAKITTTQPLSVVTAMARANNSNFSHISAFAHQMPDTSQWGKTFMADLTHFKALGFHKEQGIKVTLRILAHTASTVSITDYTGQNTRVFEMVAESIKVLPINELANVSSYVTIKSSERLLVMYEVLGYNNRTIFSIFLQPMEWFTFKQQVILTTSLDSNSPNQSHYITMIVPHDSTVLVQTKTVGPVDIVSYGPFEHRGASDTLGYTIHRVMAFNYSISNETTLLFTAIDSHGCSRELGVTLFSHSSILSYAHTNPPALDDSTTEKESELCQTKAGGEGTTTIVVATSGAVSLTLIMLLVGAIILAVLLMKPRVLFQKPDPPFKEFDYDMFISFADEDQHLVKETLYQPLSQQGYRVLWHLSDFIAGLTIAENMLRAIEQSRWVVFVCSEHFERSEFCQQELRLGLDSHYTIYRGQYRRVVPLVLSPATCPQKLKQLDPVYLRLRSQTPTSKEIANLITRLNLGKSIKTLQGEQKLHQRQRTERVITEETQSLLDNQSNIDV